MADVAKMEGVATAPEKDAWKRRCVVVCPRPDFVRPWIRAYFASGNTTPLAIASNEPGAWSREDEEYCRKAAEYTGGIVLDCSAEWERARKLASRAAGSNPGWYTKKLLLLAVARRLKPVSWAWVDDDAEMVGDIAECFAAAERSSGFVYTHFYYPNESDSRHHRRFYRSRADKDDKLAWGSFMFFHGDANERLEALDRDFPIEDDEIAFTLLYKTDPAWHEGFRDFSVRGWQFICKHLSATPNTMPRGAKILHYASRLNHAAVKKVWGVKAEILPPAPFERHAPLEWASAAMVEPVDAVFVIGSGSKNGNEELRYALRNLEANCPFVRRVYISGECPSWINKASVKHIQWPDRYDHAKDANIIDKLRRACEDADIAKNVLFCSDDQFQTRVCTWNDFMPRFLRQYTPEDEWYIARKRVWHTRLKHTLERDRKRREEAGLDTSRVFYYQPHMWMQIDRDKFLEYAKWSDYPNRTDTIIASGYFNFVDAKGVKDFDHAFLSSAGATVPKGVTHIGYLDGSFEAAMKYLKAKFPNKSRFEA